VPFLLFACLFVLFYLSLSIIIKIKYMQNNLEFNYGTAIALGAKARENGIGCVPLGPLGDKEFEKQLNDCFPANPNGLNYRWLVESWIEGWNKKNKQLLKAQQKVK